MTARPVFDRECELVRRHVGWMVDRGQVPGSVSRRVTALRRFAVLVEIGAADLLRVDEAQVLLWWARAQAAHTKTVCTADLSDVRQFFRWAMAAGLVTVNPLPVGLRFRGSRFSTFEAWVDDRELEPGSIVPRFVEWMRQRNLAETTVQQRIYVLRRFRRALGLSLGDMVNADEVAVAEWWRITCEGLAPEARCAELSHMRQFFKFAVYEGLIVADPTRRIIRPRLPRTVPRPIATVDLRRALAEVDGPAGVWLHLAGYAGLRAAEIANLRAEDVHPDANPPYLTVAQGKGGHGRIVPLAAPLAVVLAELPVRRGYLFRRTGSTVAIQPWRVSQIACAALHELGIDDTLHSLRHRFATATYAAGNDLRAVQELLGHASPVTTSRYAAFSAEKAHAAVQIAAAELAGARP